MKKVLLFLKKNLKWIVSLITLIMFIAIVRNIYANEIASFDNFYYGYISKLISDQMTFFVKVITNLGSAYALISIAVLMLLIPKKKIYGVLTSINLVAIFLLNLLLKYIFTRPRPTDINLIKELGYSFPSAHAMVGTAFYGFLIYLIWQLNIKNKQKWFYSILLGILIILICITRIYLGVHFASDVFGGFLISISYLVLFTSIIKKYLPNKKVPTE
mgnify:CR=1 FL=1